VDISLPPRPPGALRRLGAVLLPLAIFSALTAAYLRPGWEHWTQRIIGRAADPVFNLYVLKWGVHQLRLGLPALWDPNFFFPARGVLALSDHLIGPSAALLALLDLRLAPNAVAGYNLLLAGSFVLSGAVTCWVLRASGRSWIAAVLGGAMYAFAPMRWAQLGHLQILLAQWIPALLWCWDRLLAKPAWGRAAAFLAFYLLNLSGGSYIAYMMHVPLLAILICRQREVRVPRRLGVLVVVAAVALGGACLLYRPYVQAAQRYGLARTPDEVALYAATLPSYLAPAESNLYAGWWHRLADRWQIDPSDDESRLFPGFVAAALCLYAVVFWLRHRDRGTAERPARPPLALWQRAVLVALAALGVLALLAGDRQTLGDDVTAGSWSLPALVLAASFLLWLLLRRLWGGSAGLLPAALDPWERGVALGGLCSFALSFPIVFVPLMGVVPGFANLRAPGRFNVITSFAIAFFAAKGLDAWLPAAPARRRLAAAVVAALLVIELAPATVASRLLRDEADFPAVYRYLSAPGPRRALLELPRLKPPRETMYMYYSTLHWQPIANGYSGYLPASDGDLRHRVPGLPDAAGFAFLRQVGITDLVIHATGRDGAALRDGLPDWEQSWLGREVELVFAEGGDRVYRLRPAAKMALTLSTVSASPALLSER
jgi:hypothetical protein